MPKTFKISKSPANFASLSQVNPASLSNTNANGTAAGKNLTSSTSELVRQAFSSLDPNALNPPKYTKIVPNIDIANNLPALRDAINASFPSPQTPKISIKPGIRPTGTQLAEIGNSIKEYIASENPQPAFFSQEILDPSIVGMFNFNNLYESCTSVATPHISATGLYADIHFQSSMILSAFDITQLILQAEQVSNLSSTAVANVNFVGTNISKLISTNIAAFSNIPTAGTSAPQNKPLVARDFVSNIKKSYVDVLANFPLDKSSQSNSLLKLNNDEIMKNLSDINEGILATLSVLDENEKSKFIVESFFRENNGSSSLYDMLVKHFGYTKDQVNNFSRTKIFLQFLSELTALSMFRLEPHQPQNNDSSKFNINNAAYSTAQTVADYLDDNVDKGAGNYGIKVNVLPPFIQVYANIVAEKETGVNQVGIVDTIDLIEGQVERLLRLDRNNSENRFKQQLEFCVKEHFYARTLQNNLLPINAGQNLSYFTEIYGKPSNTIAKIDITPGRDARMPVPMNAIANGNDVIGSSVYTFESADLIYKDISNIDASGSAGSSFYFDSLFQKDNIDIDVNGSFLQLTDKNVANLKQLVSSSNSTFSRIIPTFIDRPLDPTVAASKTHVQFVDSFVQRFDDVAEKISEFDRNAVKYNPTFQPVANFPVTVAPPAVGRNASQNNSSRLDPGTIDPNNLGITFDRLVKAADDATLRRNMFKLLVGTCADILFPAFYYEYVYSRSNDNAEAPFPYVQPDQQHFKYYFDEFHYNCGIKSGNSIDPTYKWDVWPLELQNVEKDKVINVANLLRTISNKDLLITLFFNKTVFSGMNMLLTYRLLFDMLCQYCKLTATNFQDQTGGISGTARARSIKDKKNLKQGRSSSQTLTNALISTNMPKLDSAKSEVIKHINAQLECQRALKNLLTQMNLSLSNREKIVSSINVQQIGTNASTRGSRIRKFLNLLTTTFNFNEQTVSRTLSKHQLLMSISQIFDASNIMKDDLAFKILEPSFPTAFHKDVLFNAAKNDLLRLPGLGTVRKKILSVGIPENILDKLRIDGVGYGSKYVRQPINDFFYLTIDRFNLLNRGLQFKSKKFLFQTSRFVVKDSIPFVVPNIQNLSVTDIVKQYSLISGDNPDYASYANAADALIKNGVLKDIELNGAKSLGLQEKDLDEVRFNHALNYVLEIYIKCIAGVDVFENQFNNFFFGDYSNKTQMVDSPDRFGFLLEMPDQSVPVAFKNLLINISTNLSNPSQVALKMTAPKYFDRTFHVLFGDDDFEIDNQNSDPLVLQNFINDEFLTAKTDNDGNPIQDEFGEQVYYLNSRDFSLDQLIVSLESFTPAGPIKQTIASLQPPIEAPSSIVSGLSTINPASLANFTKP